MIVERENSHRAKVASDRGDLRRARKRVLLRRRDVDDPDRTATAQRRPGAAPGERVDLVTIPRQAPGRLDARQRVSEPSKNALAHRHALTRAANAPLARSGNGRGARMSSRTDWRVSP